MKKVAKFEKVSFNQFSKDIKNIFDNLFSDEEILQMYREIELPKRSTTGSAGYDFKIPMEILLHIDCPQLIPTGIRVKINDGWVLKLYPRSGLGFKYGVKLLNTVGIIDSDYYNSDNEGHIMAKITQTHSSNPIDFEKNSKFMQGVFVEFGITKDDDTDGIRNGGFGSTDSV